jgi:hypothetical protein
MQIPRCVVAYLAITLRLSAVNQAALLVLQPLRQNALNTQSQFCGQNPQLRVGPSSIIAPAPLAPLTLCINEDLISPAAFQPDHRPAQTWPINLQLFQ